MIDLLCRSVGKCQLYSPFYNFRRQLFGPYDAIFVTSFLSHYSDQRAHFFSPLSAAKITGGAVAKLINIFSPHYFYRVKFFPIKVC